jgi:hypothetical protein
MHFDRINYNDFYHPVVFPERKGKDAAFGCSFTYGTGVVIGKAWPDYLDLCNLGQPGYSNDRIARTAIEYINEHMPKKIYVMWTMFDRREVVIGNRYHNFFSSDWRANSTDPEDMWWHNTFALADDLANKYNFKKNRLLLSNYCDARDIKFIDMHMSDTSYTSFSKGSDGMHPGTDWHIAVADKFKKIESELYE